MGETIKQRLGFVVAAMMMVAALAVLNVGSPADAQSQQCDADGGNGGGGQTQSPSPSPTESDEPFPPSIPPILPSESESESPSPTATSTSGSGQKCDSEITMNYKDSFRQEGSRPQFTGKVKSPADECEAGRKVIVKKKRKGKDRVYDTTVTNQRGSWKVPAQRVNGKYYAQTPQERVPGENGRITCGADTSPTVRV